MPCFCPVIRVQAVTRGFGRINGDVASVLSPVPARGAPAVSEEER